jgi:BCD family chlorophyll transporter-like MFS transporter
MLCRIGQGLLFGIGGFVGTLASDIARFFLSSPALSYSTVFASEAGLFVLSAFMAVWVHRAQAKTAQRQNDVGAIPSPAVAEAMT